MEKLSVKDFNFDLPPELIAQKPLSERSSSKLLLLDKSTGKTFHRHFYNIAEYINEGDCLVLNDTRVIPARLIGERYLTGAKVELLLLKRMEIDVWETLVYPGKKAKPGDIISFGNGMLLAEILSVTDGGNRIVKFKYDSVFEQILDKLGEMPLPPYITEKLQDKNRYQTVYAKNEGSAAAPTAGLHFTDDILNSIVQKGAEIAKITLHVGLGTFRPVKTDDITEHEMHSEYFNIPQTEADKINTAKKAGKKVISVGTTSTRTIESMANIDTDTGNGCFVKSGSGWTNIFIYPPYKFKVIDSLITNFHLPESTLIMLVSALAGRENVLSAYNEAIINKYRFFSFGDAMFISNIGKQ